MRRCQTEEGCEYGEEEEEGYDAAAEAEEEARFAAEEEAAQWLRSSNMADGGGVDVAAAATAGTAAAAVGTAGTNAATSTPSTSSTLPMPKRIRVKGGRVRGRRIYPDEVIDSYCNSY
jgi:hypothetical protein